MSSAVLHEAPTRARLPLEPAAQPLAQVGQHLGLLLQQRAEAADAAQVAGDELLDDLERGVEVLQAHPALGLLERGEQELHVEHPVDGAGVYVAGTGRFAGMHIYKANDAIVTGKTVAIKPELFELA